MKKLFLITTINLAAFINVVWAACLQKDVEAADNRWMQAINSGKPQAVVDLYPENGILVPTYDNVILTTNEQRLNYFENLNKKVKNIKVNFQEKHVQLIPGAAVSSGIYTFSGEQLGTPVTMPARYTFVYQDTSNGCQLITHHSSDMPLKNPNVTKG